MKLTCLTVVILATLAASEKAKGGNPDWWKRAVFYQIYPRSFKDATNDGIGDLLGVKEKMTYLAQTGVTAIWLSPIFQSPQVDQGYDISNYTDVDPDYGTVDDLEALVKLAHDSGIKVILDFVPNHTSNKHKWFIDSENKVPGFEDFYVWRDPKKDKDGKNVPPNNWISLFKNSSWEWSEKRKQYYLHQFAIAQPDLNYRNLKVVEAMKNVLKFWLDKGVDGFRIDAVPYLVEAKDFADEPLSGSPGYKDTDYEYLIHNLTSDLQETYDIIYNWRELMDNYTLEKKTEQKIIMTEAYSDPAHTLLYYGTPNCTKLGAHFTFNFNLITRVNKNSKALDFVNAINEFIRALPQCYTPNWVVFSEASKLAVVQLIVEKHMKKWSDRMTVECGESTHHLSGRDFDVDASIKALGNHDNHRVASRFGPENVDGLNMLMAVLPGIGVTYNGEEIGQEDGEVKYEEGKDPSARDPAIFAKVSRDFERTPMQWDSTVNGGFNKGAKPWLPVSKSYTKVNVAAQNVTNITSHYNIYKSLIQLRNSKALMMGSTRVEAPGTGVIAVRRAIKDAGVSLLFNVGNEKDEIDIKSYLSHKNFVIISSVNSKHKIGEKIERTKTKLTLEPGESIILETSSSPPLIVNSSLIILILLLWYIQR